LRRPPTRPLRLLKNMRRTAKLSKGRAIIAAAPERIARGR